VTKENEEFIGKALLVIGGFALVGVIISEITGESEESTRETPQIGPTKKKNNTLSSEEKSLLDSFSKKKKLFKVQVSSDQGGFTSGIPTNSQDRKYPPSYYELSKNQQYKFRQKLAKSLYQISTEK
jgi:hypothetical protein